MMFRILSKKNLKIIRIMRTKEFLECCVRISL